MANEDKLWRILCQELEAGKPAVLCTLVSSRGSTPREPGARMLVGETGLLAGSVGGGCGEADVAVLARKVQAGFSQGGIVEVDLSGDFDQTAIQACGGTMDVLVERIDPTSIESVQQLATAEADRLPLWLVQHFSDQPTAPNWQLVTPGQPTTPDLPPEILQAIDRQQDTALIKQQDRCWFAQAVGAREQIVIVGSGHIAQPLSRMADLLGWRVIVIDDRPSYTTADRFPGATTHVGSHPELIAKLQPGRRSHVVIITRGHEHDEASLREVLKHHPAYVGMIGSKRRAIGTLKRLSEDGFSQESLAQVHTPIGLDIGAQTPEEIALAVLAEIVARRRGGTGQPLMQLRPRPKS